MKVLRVHAPATPPALAAGVGRAVAAFNRGLDIRLRFLSIGIEDTVLLVDDAAGAAEAVGAALTSRDAPLVVLFGDGPAALAAASGAVRARAVLVRVGAGRRGADADAARAVDRLAAAHVVHDDADAARLDAEGLDAPRVVVGPPDAADAGDRIVRALTRLRAVAAARGNGGS